MRKLGIGEGNWKNTFTLYSRQNKKSARGKLSAFPTGVSCGRAKLVKSTSSPFFIHMIVLPKINYLFGSKGQVFPPINDVIRFSCNFKVVFSQRNLCLRCGDKRFSGFPFGSLQQILKKRTNSLWKEFNLCVVYVLRNFSIFHFEFSYNKQTYWTLRHKKHRCKYFAEIIHIKM